LRPVWPHPYAHSNRNTDRNTHSYTNADTNGDRDSYTYDNSNSYRDSDANTNTYSNCITYTYPDADPLHWAMFTYTEAASYSGTSALASK